MLRLVINLNVSKCSSFTVGPGQISHVPWIIQYLLLVEWVTKICIWACGNVGCNVSSIRNRLLFPGMVENRYGTDTPSAYKWVYKAAQNMWGKWFPIVHNRPCKTAISERREMHKVNQLFPWGNLPKRGLAQVWAEHSRSVERRKQGPECEEAEAAVSQGKALGERTLYRAGGTSSLSTSL